jgi:putative transposase
LAQQLREATPFGQQPRYLIRDNDRKYEPAFTRVAEARGITVLRTAYRTPRQNATCERFLGSVRRILCEYTTYFNTARPHQGLQQRLPDVGTVLPGSPTRTSA